LGQAELWRVRPKGWDKLAIVRAYPQVWPDGPGVRQAHT
jgi:hypothetical protein